jgi:serine/threonine-protein kinase
MPIGGTNDQRAPIAIGRYLFYGEVARGGMASVHFGRLTGPAGFSRTVAIKKLHADFASDPEFVAMFLDEARLAARIRHPNVVSVLDVVAQDDQVFLVMDYVQGESVSRLWRRTNELRQRIAPEIASSAMVGVLHGLHAAHETRDEENRPLSIVHRDVSPQNILIGSDGIARVVDFGVAKAAVRAHTTRENQIKGKLPYMSPEQLRNEEVDRRTDVYSAGVVLWELLTGQRLFGGRNQAAIFGAVLEQRVPPPSQVVAGIPDALDELVLASLSRQPSKRPESARQMAIELERAVRPATQREVGDWVHAIAGEVLEERAVQVAEIESHSHRHARAPLPGAIESPPSQVSSISVSAASRSARPVRLGIAAGLVLFALIASVVAIAAWRTAAPDDAAKSRGDDGDVAIAAAPAPIPTASPSLAAESVPSAAAPNPPDAAPSSTPAPTRPRPRAAPASKSTSKKPASCFTIDKDGVMHPKPECL